jgi:uncharacterized membrane protein YjjB (DUF3815 family)
MSPPMTIVERYAVIGTIAGGTGNIAQAIYFDHPVVVSTFVGSVIGGVIGALYGRIRNRRDR